MRAESPFGPDDLHELDERILSRASGVISKREVHAGNHDPRAVAVRHDCDAAHSLAVAVKFAAWEAERGYRSTYYMLHTSPYWNWPTFRPSLERIALLGHEIGIHTDALAEALIHGGDPDQILEQALETLRSWGHTITGVAGHGNGICRAKPGEINFANDEQFVECEPGRERVREERVAAGLDPLMIVRGARALRVHPRPLADFGLEYEAIRVSRPAGMPVWRVSDSGGRWKHADHEPTFDEAVDLFERRLDGSADPQQLQLLVHPDWWADAFVAARVAA